MKLPVRPRLALAVIALLLGSSGCSLVIDAKAEQCESQSDCAAFGGAICSEEHVCVPGCTSNQYCIETGGDYHVCDKVAHQCVNLISDECPQVVGDWADDSAFIFGSLFPLQGNSALVGASIEQAIRLAMEDFQSANNGLPALVEGALPRPLVLVSCDDRGLESYALLAGEHLVRSGIPAVIGPVFSSLATPLVKQVAIPGKMLTISTTATSATITSIEDNGLVWRTSPSDLIQADALAQYYTGEMVQKLSADPTPVDAQDIKIAVVHKGDAYGIGLADAFGERIGASAMGARYLRRDYGGLKDDPDDPKIGMTVAAVQDQLPNVLFLIGTSVGVKLVLRPILTNWPASTPIPLIVISDGAVVPELWQVLGELPEPTRSTVLKRLTGAVPGAKSPRFDNFVGRYNSSPQGAALSPDIFGPAGAYDATYLLAYSAAYPYGGQITGPSLAEGLKRLVPPGLPSPVGQASINSAFEELKAGRNIDFDGASGPLDFDVRTGEARSDIIFLCLRDTLDGASFNGVFFDSSQPNGGTLVRDTPDPKCNLDTP